MKINHYFELFNLPGFHPYEFIIESNPIYVPKSIKLARHNNKGKLRKENVQNDKK